MSGGRIGRADGARRKQNGTECPIGQKIFGAGAISGGIYSRLLSGADRGGLLEPTGAGCWLSVSRTMARDGSADAARAWVPAPQEECARLLRFLYENSVQPELWRDAISNWYPRTAAAEVLREGGALCEL